MFGEASFLLCQLPLLVFRSNVIVVINAGPRLGVRVSSLALATSSSSQRIQFCGQLRLRLDEGAAIIAHRLVAGVGILGEESKSR